MTTHDFQPTPDWPLQAVYKSELHDRLQQWNGAVAPSLVDDDERTEKEAFLAHLTQSVERDDRRTAGLLSNVDVAIRESFRSWYTERLGHVSEEQMSHQRIDMFNALYNLYKFGASQTD